MFPAVLVLMMCVLGWFSKVDCDTKTRLFKSYCSYFYCCELWDLSDVSLQSLCMSWRLALRRIWKLPYNCHKSILHLLSGGLPLMDILCKRFYNFIHTCVNSVNGLVKYVARQGVLLSGMKSCIRRNVQFLSERYQVCIPDMLMHNLAESNFTRICQTC